MTISSGGLDAAGHRRFLTWLACLTLFAWLVRVYFIQVTQVDIPIRGDIRQYVAYAWNLLNHGTFSNAWPAEAIPAPDAFRGPGYPWFLAASMAVGSTPESWYPVALQAQALLGALTVTGTVLLARHWLSAPWALGSGVLVAIWPHHVAATGALLTEVFFGFLLVAAMLATSEAHRRRSIQWGLAAGALFSLATLTNTIALLFPLLVAGLFWQDRMQRVALALLAVSLLGPGLWALRSASIDQQPAGHGRMVMNLVQGAWPQYHGAFRSQATSPISRGIMRAISEEEVLLASDAAAGATRIGERMARDPVYYLRWYLLEKPFLLWDWDIRIGAGDVYFHEVTHSPLESNPILSASKTVLRSLNPVTFLLSALASIWLVLGRARTRAWAASTPVIVAGFCIYATMIHVLFQAEPRYSIPYRPLQVLMLATALAAAWGAVRVRLTRLAPVTD